MRLRIARRVCVLALALLAGAPGAARAQRQMEHLNRGIAAVAEKGRVFVSWRLLGTDPDGVAFNLYRTGGNDGAPAKLNDRPLAGPTHFADERADRAQVARYFVRPVVDGREGEPSEAFTLPANSPDRPYLPIPIQLPDRYRANDASVGDLDGDGAYEIVLHVAGRGADNGRDGRTDPPIFQAYKLDGTLLWTINLGRNIREGAHYTQFLVYDFDGDGRAEMACKTSDGTVDGKGKVIGDAAANHVGDDGRIMKGPEFLTVFDGLTGAALATERYAPARTEKNPENPDLEEYGDLWGDNRGNRGERYLAAVAYLDGKRPSIVMCRGYYARSTLAAWDYRDGKLTQRWLFDSGPDRKSPYFGQGNHNLSVADVDGDGRDEIVYGGSCIDDDGEGLWSTELGHGDAMHVGDLDPANPGLEMFRIQERFGDAGAHMVDAKTGKVLWRKPSVKAADEGGDKGEGPGRGVAFDIDPRHAGSESWTAGAGIEGVWDAKGNEIGKTKPANCNFAVWWDGDLTRELLDNNNVWKWNWEKQTTDLLFTDAGARSINGTKATPVLSADLFGDWREEFIWRSDDNRELRVYTTTIPTEHRFYTFMHDPQYRLGIAWQNVAYNQPPHPSFHVGPGMKQPPRPQIEPVKPAGKQVAR